MLGLYVHIPFCSIKCYYCGFAAFSGQHASAGRYLAALDREASCYSGAGKPETLYIGGGTPTELSAQQLDLLLQNLSTQFGAIAEFRESTVEASPESLDLEKLQTLRESGVSRLSIGLQTTSDRLLKAIGRRHSYEDFKTVFGQAKRLGFDVSVDLMLGLPGQTLNDACGSLQAVQGLDADHISVYCLQVEDKTLFAKRAVKNDESLARDMYEATIERLASEGWVHYEISNFARPGKESIHNVNYWNNGSYIGLGCGAAGFLGGVRYQNEERLAPYLRRAESGERPVASSERLSGKEGLGEAMLLRLRLLKGFGLTPEMESVFRGELEGLLGRGLITLDGGCSKTRPVVKLSPEGRFLANEAFRAFVAPFAEHPATMVGGQ